MTTKEELKNYSQDEIMDYFTRQVVDQTYKEYSRASGSGGSRSTADSSELTITDSFGFIDKTLDPSMGPSGGKVAGAVDD